jgi:hypothetical protein
MPVGLYKSSTKMFTNIFGPQCRAAVCVSMLLSASDRGCGRSV